MILRDYFWDALRTHENILITLSWTEIVLPPKSFVCQRTLVSMFLSVNLVLTLVYLLLYFLYRYMFNQNLLALPVVLIQY